MARYEVHRLTGSTLIGAGLSETAGAVSRHRTVKGALLQARELTDNDLDHYEVRDSKTGLRVAEVLDGEGNVINVYGYQIRHERQARGLSQDELARELGVATGTVARWEQGGAEPTGLYRQKVEEWLSDGKQKED